MKSRKNQKLKLDKNSKNKNKNNIKKAGANNIISPRRIILRNEKIDEFNFFERQLRLNLDRWFIHGISLNKQKFYQQKVYDLINNHTEPNIIKTFLYLLFVHAIKALFHRYNIGRIDEFQLKNFLYDNQESNNNYGGFIKIFSILDEDYTKFSNNNNESNLSNTTNITTKLAEGQDLRKAISYIKNNPEWKPIYKI